MIISASRRTDIPAFFSEWFFNRLSEGFVVVRNPFNSSQMTKLRLDAEAVDAVVFWTKDPRPALGRLHELDSRGIPYYFQFTLTPYGQDVEPGLPADKRPLIEAFKELATAIGPGRVVWRYDPILLSEKYSLGFHRRAFEKCASSLAGSTRRLVISFIDMDYSNAKALGETGVGEGTDEEKRLLAASFSKIARDYGMSIETCAEAIELDDLGIRHGRCIDPDLIEEITGKTVLPKWRGKAKGQRRLCGCMASFDIGEYSTCPHGCAYCYANRAPSAVHDNFANHDPTSPTLIGDCDHAAIPFKKDQTSVCASESHDPPQLF